jgi:iron-sulfur cluster insertion protein
MTFSLSDTAVQRLAFLLSKEPEGTRMRVAVEGGGCSGFQYRFSMETAPMAEDDHVFAYDGVAVVVDAMSLELVQDGQLDFITKLGASYFAMVNPNSTASCGCGNSFSV